VNIKKGLNRIWIVVSVLWVGFWMNVIIPSDVSDHRIRFLGILTIGLVVWWGLLYTGFWISSGFREDDEKKGETDE
jgi:hypothetical protein